MKLDLQKAYDRVNWKFLRVVLLNFGFHESFVNLILQCVSSMSFFCFVQWGEICLFSSNEGIETGGSTIPLSLHFMPRGFGQTNR